jgi:hypothetical protein
MVAVFSWIVAMTSREGVDGASVLPVGVLARSSSSSGKLPGIVAVLVWSSFLTALLAVASLLRAALSGSDRPSVIQFGFGKLNKEDLSELESLAGTNMFADLNTLDVVEVGLDAGLDVVDLGGIPSEPRKLSDVMCCDGVVVM